jgi:DNA-directed RNA polymerase subunit RPC12/RpoP
MAEPEPEEQTDDTYFDPEGPGAHDEHLLDDDTEHNDYVDCVQCGARILAFAERCPQCGHWFEAGEAWRQEEEAGFPRWLMITAGLVVVALVLWLVLP